MSSIFLSHSHENKQWAWQIYKALVEDGIDCWLDEAEIKPGDSTIAKIEQAIDEMDYLGVVLSRASVNSTWVLYELRMALTAEIKGRHVRVIGLLVEDSLGVGWYAAHYGEIRMIKLENHGIYRTYVFVARHKPERSWIFKSRDDKNPRLLMRLLHSYHPIPLKKRLTLTSGTCSPSHLKNLTISAC